MAYLKKLSGSEKELKKYVLYPQDVQPTLNKPFMSGQSQFQEDYKTLPIGYVKTYNERSKLYWLL